MAISLKAHAERSASFFIPADDAGDISLNALAALLPACALKDVLAVDSADQTAEWVAEQGLSIFCSQGVLLSGPGILNLDAADSAIRVSLAHSMVA